MNAKEKERLTKLKSEVAPLISQVRKKWKKMTYKKIGLAVGKDKEVVAKWATEKSKPDYEDVEFVVNTLKELLESPANIFPTEQPQPKETEVHETDHSYEKKAKLVSVFYDHKIATRPYKEPGVIGDLLRREGKGAIIGHKNEGNQFENADAYIYASDDALAPEIKYGYMVFIKKIKWEELIPGKRYFFISNEEKCMGVLEKVEKAGNEWEIKMVSPNKDIPAIERKSSQVEAIYRITGVSFNA